MYRCKDETCGVPWIPDGFAGVPWIPDGFASQSWKPMMPPIEPGDDEPTMVFKAMGRGYQNGLWSNKSLQLKE